MADLKSELSGDLARLILGLMMPPAHYDAKQLKKAMEVKCGHQRDGVQSLWVWTIRSSTPHCPGQGQLGPKVLRGDQRWSQVA